MHKIYETTVTTLDCNDNPDNSMVFRFDTAEDQMEFSDILEHLKDLDEVNFDYQEDEYFTNTLDGAKKEVKSFLGLEDS